MTLKRNTLYDRAKLKVYLEHCRVNKKKAEFDEIKVCEDEVRLAIQEMHDSELTEEYAKREKLMQKLISMQVENNSLA